MSHPTSDHPSDLLARRSALGPAYRLFYDEPFAPVRGQDVWLYDQAGKRYLDAYNNVPVVDHCHPRVVEAMQRQAATLNTHTRYLHATVLEYAERLLAKFPAALDTVMFTCTGSEANDLALRVARAVTGGVGIIVTRNAYHGVTAALADISPSLHPTAPHVRTVPAPDALRGMGANEASECFRAHVQEAIDDLQRAGIKPAALIVDTVFASDGIFVAPQGILDAAASAIRAAGGVFIADEVQGGFGRMGRHWWAFQREAVQPDIVTLGKPMGNGYPMGGMVLRRDLATEFAARGRYFNTFGGNPVAAAVGLAVLETLEQDGFLQQVQSVGHYLHTRLTELAVQHDTVIEPRGGGLYHGLELVTDKTSLAPASGLASLVLNRLRQGGVLVGVCGPQANVLKIRPPLTFTRDHADLLLAALQRALAET